MRRFFNSVFYIFLAVYFIGCQDDAGTISVNQDELGKDYSLAFVDTTSLLASTILLDSMPTSNTGTVLLGKQHSGHYGTIGSDAYMIATLGSQSFEPNKKALTFRGLELRLKYSGYYYGDTTITQSFDVLRVTEKIKWNQVPAYWYQELDYPLVQQFLFPPASLYNNTNFETGATIGTIAFKPRPRSTAIITIGDDQYVDKLTEVIDMTTLGQEWIAEAKKDSGAFNNGRNFVEYFKGIKIKSKTDGAIFGIVMDSSAVIRLRYSENSKNYYYDFPLAYTSSTLAADRSSTALANLDHTNNEISSKLTSNQVFIESGLGIFAKVRTPYLKDLLLLQGFRTVNSAKLIIEPVEGTYDYENPLPSRLVLLRTDSRNLPLEPIAANFSNSSFQSAFLQVDETRVKSPQYVFTVTEYIQSKLIQQSNLFSSDLLISTPVRLGDIEKTDFMKKTVDRVSIGDGKNTNYRMRLEIYYLRSNQ